MFLAESEMKRTRLYNIWNGGDLSFCGLEMDMNCLIELIDGKNGIHMLNLYFQKSFDEMPH